jgi:hypothetical protein
MDQKKAEDKSIQLHHLSFGATTDRRRLIKEANFAHKGKGFSKSRFSNDPVFYILAGCAHCNISKHFIPFQNR